LEEKYTQKPLLPVDPQLRALNLQVKFKMIDLDLHHECIESRLILTANPTGLVSSEGIQWEKANLVMNSYA